MKKKSVISFIFIFLSLGAFSQSYNQDNIALANFITRMYNHEPFSGVKIFLDYKNKYLLSVVSLIPGSFSSENALIRTAEVKSRAQANQFLNNSYISSESIIVNPENPNSKITPSVIETIRESSYGFVESMQLITNFMDESSGKKVFIFAKILEKIDSKSK